MKKINEIVSKEKNLKESVLQFGEGNFLRAFVDWMIENSNEEGNTDFGIVIAQPIKTGLIDKINDQDGLYTLVMRGKDDQGEREAIKKIKSVTRGINPYSDFNEYRNFIESEDLKIVVSNTTEAGITYQEENLKENEVQDSFPAKICQLLYLRYKKYKGDINKGLLFLPVELIDDNGFYLRKYVLKHAKNWNLSQDFVSWIDKANEFSSTLVDRIVTGKPSKKEHQNIEEKIGYKDQLIVTSELFNLWVIEASEKAKEKFPVKSKNINIIWTDNVKPYKTRKVRILNGAHTSTVPLALLAGYDIVREFMYDETFKIFLNNLIDKEVIPYIEMDKKKLKEFKEQVFLRFENPYIDHKLISILLNSISKFQARCIPSVIDYIESENEIPNHFALALAALIRLYKVEVKDGKFISENENGTKLEIKDDVETLTYFAKLSDEDFCKKAYPYFVGNFDNKEFKNKVLNYYKLIIEKSVKEVIEGLNE